MPVYNAGIYIKEAIDSIMSQSFKRYELIIINDGSTDNTIEVINNYNDKRIVLINNTHDYINSLNIGISTAKGKYIARMDADDIMVSNRLQIQYNFLENNPNIHVCGGGMQLFGIFRDETKPKTKHSDIVIKAMEGSPLNHPTVMMRTSLRNLFRCDNMIYQMYHQGYQCAEDYKLWIDLIIKGYKIENIPVVLIHYRTHKYQSTVFYKKEMIESIYKIQCEYINIIMNKIIECEKDYSILLAETSKLFALNKISFASLKIITKVLSENVKHKLANSFIVSDYSKEI